MNNHPAWQDITREEFIENIGKDFFSSFEEELDCILTLYSLIGFQISYSGYNNSIQRQIVVLVNTTKNIKICLMIVQGEIDLIEASVSVFAKMGTEFYQEVQEKWPYLHISIKNKEEINSLINEMKQIICLVKN